MGYSPLVVGIVGILIGSVMLESKPNLWGYSSSMRSLMEFGPFFFLVLGGLCVLGGIFYLTKSMKPSVTRAGKVIEKNNLITVEFTDNTREILVSPANIVLGDQGIFETKGNIVVNFHKQ